MNTRYQAFILIGVILISTYAFKFAPELAQSDVSDTQEILQRSSDEETPQRTAMIYGTAGPELIGSDVSSDRPAIQEQNASACSASAKIYFVRNLTDGSVKVEKGMHNRWPIASITKLMSAIIAYDTIPADARIEITPQILAETEGYSSFAAGEVYSANDLIRAALAFSSNDAAYALAYHIGMNAFVQDMNEKAKSLMMSDTHFNEPSGLSYLNQSSAYDLSLLMKHMYDAYPSLLATTRLPSVTLRELTSGKSRKFNNIDYFAGTSGFIGGKTGSTEEAGQNLVTLFERGGALYSVVVFSSPDRFAETTKLLSCAATQSAALIRR